MAQLSVEMTGDDVKLWKALQKVVHQEGKVGKGLDDINRKGKRAGKGVAGAMGSVKTSLLALAGPAAVFATLARYASKAQTEIKGVGEALKGAEAGMKQMWQVSEGHEIYNALSLATKKSMATEGLNREAASSMAFALKGKDLEQKLLRVALAGRFMDPAVATNFYTMVSDPVNFGRTTTVPRAMSALLAGAKPSDFNTTQTAQLMNKVTPTMKALGSSLPEILAVGSVLSVTSDKSPEIAATRMIAGAKIIDKAGFGGRGLLAGLKAMRDADAELYNELKQQNVQFKQFALGLEGEGSAIAAERIPLIRKEWVSPTLFRSKTNTPAEITLLRQSRVAAAQRELSAEQLARERMRLDVATDRGVALANVTGGSLGAAMAYRDALGAAATFGMTQEATRYANEGLVNTLEREFPAIYGKYLEGVVPPPPHAVPIISSPYGGNMLYSHQGPRMPAVLSEAQAKAIADAVAAAVRIGIERQSEELKTIGEAADAAEGKMRRQAELIGEAIMSSGGQRGRGYELRKARIDDREADVW